MQKEEARVLEANRRINQRMRARQEAGVACLTCNGDGLKQQGIDWIKCDGCGGSGLISGATDVEVRSSGKEPPVGVFSEMRALKSGKITPAIEKSTPDELPLSKSRDRLIGKVIVDIEADACNHFVFIFEDGSRVAFHVECEGGLPDVQTCLACA